MRILQVIPFFTPKMGGSAMVAFQMARHLAEKDHEVTVVTSDHNLSDTRFDTGTFETIYLSCISRWGFYLTPGLVSWARSQVPRFDLVHMHTLRTFQNAVVGYYARKNNIPYVISAHGTLPVIVERMTAKRLYDRLAGQKLLDGAACLVAVSPFEARQYRGVGIEEERIRVIYNGLDLEEFKNLPPRGTFRQRLGIPAETPIILFLGRLHRRKGIDHLVQAFAQIRCQLNGAKLLIVGPDGGEERVLR
ncbi:MAG TPA: glycosyltransferase, partial [candidate division Zixibacteria bacterium]|nr:glycosyltransferase [candidate division Zixibacteria bacterium]